LRPAARLRGVSVLARGLGRRPRPNVCAAGAAEAVAIHGWRQQDETHAVLANVRLIVWNMGSGGPGGSAAGHERAWRYLLEEHQFEIALLQETRRPPDWASDHLRSSTWGPKYATARRNRPLWGCAVVSTSLELLAFEPPAEYPWLRERAGSVAADAETEVRVTGWRVDERPATSMEPHSDCAPVIVEIRHE
jgi:hypothetical protein